MSDFLLGRGDDVTGGQTRRSEGKPLNIGVIGYYGFGNLGDEMLLNAIRRFLMPHRVIAFPFSTLPTRDALDRLNGFDYLILGGGGLFNRTPGAPFDTFDRWAPELRPPISVLGLGVERLDAQYVPAIHCLVERSDYFVVRDLESKRLIGHPKVQVAPDLTFYQPLPRAESRALAGEITCGVNLRPLHRGVETWIEAIAALPCRKHALPFSLVPTYDDREPLAQIVGGWPKQATLEVFQQLDIVIGTAFHAIVFAIQAGVPAVAINYHPKVRRLMEEVGLAEYVLEWDEPQRLRACFERAIAERDSIGMRMGAYTEMAQARLTSLLSEVRTAIEKRAISSEVSDRSVSSAPRVTVFVLCHGADQSDVTRTVRSCLAQTYPQVEIVLVDGPEGVDATETLSASVHASSVRVSSIRTHFDGESLAAMSGDYVTWIPAGSWFSEDGLDLMVRRLSEHPDAALVHSDYYITHEGNIDRKISLRPIPPGGRLPLGPSFLLRRQFAAEIWRALAAQQTNDVFPQHQAVHLSQPVFYQPSTEGERKLYLSAVAYGRGRIDEGKKLLAEAVETDPGITQSPAAFEQDFCAFLDAGFNRLVAADPVKYLETVCAALPVATARQRSFARKFVGRAHLELAYMFVERGERHRTHNSLLKAFWNDPALLSNRGAVRLLVKSLVGSAIVGTLRRPRLLQGFRS